VLKYALAVVFWHYCHDKPVKRWFFNTIETTHKLLLIVWHDISNAFRNIVWGLQCAKSMKLAGFPNSGP